MITLVYSKRVSVRNNLLHSVYYEESLISSNLNSIQLRFHGVRPNLSTSFSGFSRILIVTYIIHKRQCHFFPIFWPHPLPPYSFLKYLSLLANFKKLWPLPPPNCRGLLWPAPTIHIKQAVVRDWVFEQFEHSLTMFHSVCGGTAPATAAAVLTYVLLVQQ